ncbi:MAG: hypothetical protein QG625_558 [Cyanobacteriota bacterium erpe_2018_sw_39hr_WHONDRS-SW48-000098_B_bin.30]|nr:hypothetical protein [Cyanobacteriota bacterium erpe_2018_sw_39hr_WHONDRS-SW48-000098_B_bin.30]
MLFLFVFAGSATISGALAMRPSVSPDPSRSVLNAVHGGFYETFGIAISQHFDILRLVLTLLLTFKNVF